MTGVHMFHRSLLHISFICLLLFISLDCSEIEQAEEHQNNLQDNVPVPTVQQSFLTIFDDNLLSKIFDCDPNVQVSLKQLNRTAANIERNERPYQRLLGLNLNVPNLALLPLHGDLKVFENIIFPSTVEGQISGLIFVFKMAQNVLRFSPIYTQVIEAVFDAAAALAGKAQYNPQPFQAFLLTSRFDSFPDSMHVVKHFVLNRQNIHDLVLLKCSCRALLANLEQIILRFPREEQDEIFIALAHHVTEHPQDFASLFEKKSTAFKIALLLSSESPIEWVNELLHQEVTVGMNSDYFFQAVVRLLTEPVIPTTIGDEHIYPRLNEIINYILSVFIVRDQPRAMYIRKTFACLKLFLKCFFLPDYTLIEAEITNPSIYDQQSIQENLVSVLVVAKRYNDALQYLPESSYSNLLYSVSNDEEFCALLVQQNPIWIRQHFANDSQLVFRNETLMFSFFDAHSYRGVYTNANQDQLLEFAPQIYANAPLKVVKKFISRIAQDRLQDHYVMFWGMEIEDFRFTRILRRLLRRCQVFNSTGQLFLNVNQLIALLETEDFDIFFMLEKGAYGLHLQIDYGVLFEILHSETLKSRVMAHSNVLHRFFNIELNEDIKEMCRSPMEVYCFSKLLETNRIKLVKEVIGKLTKKFLQHAISYTDMMISLIGIGRVWLSADPILDHCDRTKKVIPFDSHPNLPWDAVFLVHIYHAFTNRGYSAFFRAYSEAALRQKSVMAEIEDDQEFAN